MHNKIVTKLNEKTNLLFKKVATELIDSMANDIVQILVCYKKRKGEC